MRGALLLYRCEGLNLRIIPADAGSTHSILISDRMARDHPRGCGEHMLTRRIVDLYQGSSPRMRGAQPAWWLCLQYWGIIPADAGSTCADTYSVSVSGDHPRGCGEHEPFANRSSCWPGSSPRMRGAHIGRPFFVRTGRIIPADAGSTLAWMGGHHDMADHPRGCGEHADAGIYTVSVWGSSPRMRGARTRNWWRGSCPGIIPADAGSTVRMGQSWLGDWDHPRGCGEHIKQIRIDMQKKGSSPRMRGALRAQRQ